MILVVTALAACGGGGSGGGGDDDDETVIEFQLLDPTPGSNDFFGAQVVILDNGNIVVTDPGDSSIADENGGVHLYNPATRALISSIYGDQAGDQLGLHGITALPNSNYVICSQVDDNGSIQNAGSVILVDGSTGLEILSQQGEQTNDFLCRDGITVLDNGNYVISSGRDDSDTVTDVGSVRLINGTTGVEIASLQGDLSFDRIGSGSITVLSNNNYVVASPGDDEGLITSAGSARLIDGSTGLQISALIGDNSFDEVGSRVAALGNGNYVVASNGDDDGFSVDVGSVRLMNGVTGAEIGIVFGDDNADSIGDFITTLSNNNYVVTSINDDNGATENASSVRLMDGVTGNQISVIFGDESGDALGQLVDGTFIAENAVTVLSNNNYIVTSPSDNNGAIDDAGSVRLMNGASGAQIGSTRFGDQTEDRIGESGITVLANDNFIIASSRDDNNTIVDAGSAQLINGTSGDAIGALLIGESSRSRLTGGGVAGLANNNYVVASGEDNNGSLSDTGSIRLFDGVSGDQINVLFGDNSSDLLGLGAIGLVESVINVMNNNNFVILSPFNNNGSVRLIDGVTGVQLEQINGMTSSDLAGGAIDSSGIASTSVDASIVAATDSSYFLIAAPAWDNNETNAGLVQMITP